MKIYSCDISKTNDSDFELWFKKMSEERKEGVRKLLIPHKQKSKIASDNLCRHAISEFCNVSPDSIEFGITEKGKPYAKGLEIYFNISHSGDLAVCAVSDKEIGIDIEKIRKINPNSAKKFAAEAEIEYINSHRNGFFEIWTLKEAYFKCIGTGLGADIKNVCFETENEKIICSEKGFNCSFHNIAEGYICSVCEKE